jgi:hypothetical protein
MATYKVSYVITGSDHPGAIVSRRDAPKVGDIIKLGNDLFEVIEVLELMPPRGDFHYFHATCRANRSEKAPNSDLQ